MLNKHHSHGGFAHFGRKTSSAIALALVLILPGCIVIDTDSAERETDNPNTEIAQQLNNDLIGKTVTIDGELARGVTPKAFVLESDEFAQGQEVLIVSAEEVPFRQGISARVTGTVRERTIADIEREYDVDLDSLGAESEEQPFMVATQVALSPSLETLATRTNWFLGATVTVTAEVERVFSENSYTIDNDEILGENDLLVVSSNPVGDLEDGERIQVTGQFRRLTMTQLEDEFNLGAAEVYEVYLKNQPVIIAQTTKAVTDD
jgi:hypothetical protein